MSLISGGKSEDERSPNEELMTLASQQTPVESISAEQWRFLHSELHRLQIRNAELERELSRLRLVQTAAQK